MELKILRVGNDGEGIGFYNKKPVYVYYAYKGETVDIDLITNKRGAYEGIIKRVTVPSEHRVSPICPYYTKVGTSNLMHISYKEQLNYKKELIHYHLNTKLKKLARSIYVYPTIPSKDVFYYRNKIDVPVKFIGGENKMGLYERGTNRFLPIDSYVLHEKVLDKAANDALSLMDKYEINAYNSKTRKGYVTHLSIRANELGEVQLTFVLKKKVDLNKLVEELVKINSKIVSVYYSFVPKLQTTRDLFSKDVVKLFGESYLKMTLKDKIFLLAPNAFFQLNTKQALKLFETVVRRAKLSLNDVVLDAYSGVGTIATFISPYVKEVVAIEKIGPAVKANKKANKLNHITNIRALTGDVINTVNYLKMAFDVMIFDPPREGLKKAFLNFILKNSPKKIVYVSCNPETLAEDLLVLSQKYKIESVTPFDMFPQTSHTESITILHLK